MWKKHLTQSIKQFINKTRNRKKNKEKNKTNITQFKIIYHKINQEQQK